MEKASNKITWFLHWYLTEILSYKVVILMDMVDLKKINK